jgi:hypothetical protein
LLTPPAVNPGLRLSCQRIESCFPDVFRRSKKPRRHREPQEKILPDDAPRQKGAIFTVVYYPRY